MIFEVTQRPADKYAYATQFVRQRWVCGFDHWSPLEPQRGEVEAIAVRPAQVNADGQSTLAARFAICCTPTLAIFKNSLEMARHPGMVESTCLASRRQSHA